MDGLELLTSVFLDDLARNPTATREENPAGPAPDSDAPPGPGDKTNVAAEHTACLDRVGTSLPRCSGLSRPPVPFPPRSRPPLPFGATLNARLQLRIHTRSPLESHFFCAALHVGLPAETPALSASATGSRWSQPKGDESNKADVISEKIRGPTWQRASTRGTVAK